MAQQNNFIVDLIANLNTTLFNRQMRNLQNQRYNVNVGVNNNSLKNTHAQMRQLGTATQNTNSVFGKLKNTLSNTFSAGRLSMTGFLAVLNEINKAGRNAKETIKEIDKAVTDLSVATNMSREAVSGLVKEYNSYAKDLKSTTTQITDAADAYLRAGKSMNEIEALIKDSIMLSKLGQIEASAATEDLLATMNGFNMSVEEVGKALDAMVAIDMKAATSSGDISTALKYCASSADVAGVSFSKLAAMIGTVQDKTQQSAETVGTFMNTLLSRYRNVKIGQFVDDDGEDLSEVETILKSLDLKLRDSNQEFRNFEVVLDEVASKWNTYSSVQQAAIAKAFSGTRQQNRFIALMEGYNKTLELTEVAANSAGTAVEKFNKSYADSLEAKKNTLQASFESLIMNSDLDKVYSGILEATNALVQFINKANALKGVFTSLAVTGGIKAFMSIKTGVTQAYIALNQFQQALNLVKQPKIATNDFTRLLMLTKNLSASQMKLILSSKSLTLTQKKQLLMNQGLSESEARLKLQNMGLATSYTGLKAATVSVTNACKGLFSTLLANKIFLVATAVSMATMAWQSYKQKIEEIRQKTVELTNSYKEQQDSLDSQIAKYKELKDSLDKGNLSTDETRSIKEQLLEIQKSLIESYGNEASNIDLVNGKYKEQLGLLSELSKEKATDYVTENRDVFADAKEALEKIREYELGTVTSWSSYAPETEEQKRLVEYLETYSDFLELTKSGSNYGSTYATSVKLSVKADVGNADELMHQLSKDLEQYGKDNNIDVSGLLEGISEQLKKTWTDELTDYKTIYDEFMKAEIVRNDTLRPLYQQSIKAVEDYNSALSTGEGVEKAKANLDSVQQSVQNATGELEGSQDVFDGIYDGINKDAEAAYNLGQAFENDKTVQNYAEQLRGLMDIDLKAINFKDTVEQPGEKAFTALMDYLGYTEDQVQMLIDKLVEFGYVQGEIQDTASDISAPFTKSEMISAINEMSEGFEELDKIFESISDKDPFDFKLLDDKAFKETFGGLGEEYTNFIEIITSSPNDINACKSAFNDLVGAWIESTGILDKVDESTAGLTASMLKMMGVENAEEIVKKRLIANEEELTISKIYLAKESKNLENATEDERLAFIAEQIEAGNCGQALALLELKKQLVNGTLLDTNSDVENVLALAKAAGISVDALSKLSVAKANFDNAVKTGDGRLIGSAAIELQHAKDDIEKAISDFESPSINYTGGNKSNKSSSSSDSKKDAWLEEYKKKLSMLEDQLDQQLINEKEFYDQSEALLNQYLKDTPAHIEKYAEEISDAEKKLHDNWNSAFDFEKGNLEDKLSDKLITDIEYYKELSKLNNEYYRPTGMLDNGNVISDEQITSVREYADVLAKLKDSADINTEPEFASAFEKISKVAKESGVSVENLIETYNKFLEGDDRYGNFAEEFEDNNRDIRDSLRDLYKDLFDNLNKSVDEMQSAFTTIGDAMKEYSEKQALSIDTVQELLSLNPLYLSMLMDENGQLQLNEEAYQKLAKAKLEQMVSDMGLSVAEQILAIETTEQAKALMEAGDANLYMADTSRIAADQAVSDALDIARARSIMQNDSSIYDAAQMLLQSYENAKKLIPMVSFDTQSLRGGSADKEKEEKEDKYSKDFEWIERLLERLSKATEKITKTIEKYINYVKKNNAINRAVKSIDTEVTQNRNAYDFYMSKARAVGLDAATVRKIQNGSISAETITDEGLGGKIDEYMEWYDKAQDVKDAIDDLFEQQRDLISQKLDNILSYYSDMDSYLSSITSKVESLISLNDEMGKRSSLTELVEQFANLNKQIESVTVKGEAVEVVKKQIASGTAESVQKAVADDNAKESERIQSEIDNLDVTQSGTYQKLLKDIEKTQAKIAQYEEKGWDVKKVKQYEKLQKQLENYYAQQEALDDNATSNTVANYSKVYLAWQKLMNNTSYQKLLAKESDGTLKANEQKRLDKYNKQLADYEAQMEKIKNEGQSAIAELENQKSIIEGTAEKTTEAQKIDKQIKDIENNLKDTAIYKNLEKNIENTQNKIAELDAIGYDNLTKKQKKTYDKLTATLEDYYAQKESLDEGATASNIAEYNKIYLAWKKLQDKLDLGKNLSTSEWKKYNTYTEQLENWVNDKATQYEELNSQLQDALNPPDKQGVIKKEYEESSKQMYNSYQNQIDAINDEVKATQNYKNLLANIQKLEQKKDTKGLSKAEEDKLKKYQAELEALEKGGTATNVADYMKTWEAWYKLQQKLDSGKNLSASEASKYDEYRAKLEAWNNEKQTQINDLLSQMEDDLEKLNKTYLENVSEAESEIDEYYANLYNLAKQIAEYNINALEQQLSVIQSMVSYYQNLAGLYETFSGDKLSRLLVDLDEDTALSKLEIYQKELSSLNEQYDVNKKKMKEYQQLLDALDTNNFESSMALFNAVLNDSSVSQATKDNLQQVIDLLNERALSADNWGEYADQWENEWQQALADTKQSLIEVAGSIQEVNDAIRETSFESLTDAITQLGYLKDTLSSITGLINDDWIFDEDGELTEYGNAKVSLLVEQMQTARNEADKYAQQINAIMSMRDTYSSENAYQTALQEAKSNYLSSLNELKGFEDSVVSIMTQSNETIVNSLKDVISARIKALKAQKDLYEYNKTITNSQKEIDNIKAQIDALENLTGATDAATKAKLAQLKADLEEKETALQETKDDHTYNLQITALEDFMDTLDQTMSDAADAVNKSFAAYKEAIDSALNVYEENKDYLGEWSNTIMKNVLGLANTDGTNTIDVDVQQSGSGESQSNLPTIKVENGDTVSAIESSNGTLHGDLIDIKTAIEQGIIVKVDSPLTAINPEMMNFVRNYVPPMTNAVVNTLPQIAERKATQNVINVHYDNIIGTVEGSVDKDFAKVLPDYLEKSFKYTTDKMYREQVILNGGNRRIRR